MNDEARAREIAYCTCGNDLPEKMRTRGDHFANCHAELVEEIAASLTAARRETWLAAAEVARNFQCEGMRDSKAMALVVAGFGEAIAAAIEAKATED